MTISFGTALFIALIVWLILGAGFLKTVFFILLVVFAAAFLFSLLNGDNPPRI
jgi:hypothetical protein